MEKHIIFLYPLHPVIQELKDALEKDGSYDINEVDNANEYRQLVGIIGQCVTFTSDIKKIQSTIDSQAQLIKNGISKVVIMGKLQNFNSEIHQLRVLGVQEILPETTPLKSLQFKLNLFIKNFEAAEEKEKKEKIKESEVSVIKSKKAGVSLFDEELIENLKKLKREEEKEAGKSDGHSAFDLKGFVKQGITPFTVGPVNPEKKKSLFKPLVINQNYDRRSVKASGEKLKFDEIEEEKKQSEKINHLNHYQSRESKKTADIEFDKESKSITSSGKFVDEPEKKSLKKSTQDQLSGYNNKSSGTSSKISFDEENQNKDINPKVEDLHKLKSYKSERLTDDIENQKDAKKLTKEEKLQIRKKELEEIGEGLKRKKIGEKFVNDEEADKIKGLEIKNENIERKKYNAFHVDDLEVKKRDTRAEVDDIELKKGHSSLRLSNNSERKPYVPFHVDSSNEKNHVEVDQSTEKLYQDDKMTLTKEKNWGEQTIDYQDFENERSEKVINRPLNTGTQAPNEISDEDYFLSYPTYFWPPDGISTFIPLLLEVLQSRPFDQNKLIQFICFMFNKKLGGHLTYFIEKENEKNDLLGSSYLIGDKTWKYEEHYSEFDISRMRSIHIPTWSDSTFQGKTISFVFPFFYNKQRMGFAYAHFDISNIRNEQEALEAELLIVMARTVFLKEFGY